MRNRIVTALVVATTTLMAAPVAAPVHAAPLVELAAPVESVAKAPPHAIRLRPNQVAENEPAGTVVGRFVVRDRDRRDRHRIKLVRGKGSADNGSFRIRGKKLVTKGPFDFEAQPVLRIRVRATDRAGHRFARSLRVRVTDVDDSGQCGDCVLHPPVAVDDAVTTIEDTRLTLPAAGPESLVANDTDEDGDTLAVVGVTAADGGSVSLLADGSVRFEPWSDRCGSTAGQFDYTVSDGRGGRDVGRVEVAITCVYDAPVAVDDRATVAEDGGTTIPVLANDRRNDGALAISSVTQPPDGTVAIVGNEVTYTPDADFCTDGAADEFRYALTSGGSARVAVQVTCEPDAPVVTLGTDTAVAVEDGAAVTIDPDITLTDPEGEIEAVAVQVQGAEPGDLLTLSGSHPDVAATWESGTATLALAGSGGPADAAVFEAALRDVTFATTTSDLGAAGRTITVTVADPDALSDSVDKDITVTAANDAPVITASAALSVDENGLLGSLGISIADPDAGTGTLTIELSAEHGELTLDGDTAVLVSMTGTIAELNAALPTATYTPNPKYDGPDTITVTVNDNGNTGIGGARTDTATIEVTVDGDNDAPSAADHTFEGVGNTSLVTTGAVDPPGPQVTVDGSLLDGASDPDDPAGSLSVVAETKATDGGGLVTIEEDGEFSYLPGAGCTDDTFEYTITDNRSEHPETDVATVTVDLVDCVWYVDEEAAGSGTGTSQDPATDVDGIDAGTGDVIYLAAGTYSALTLDDDQRVYTERSGLVVGTHELVTRDPSRDRTQVVGGLIVATGNTVQGLDLGDAGGFALTAFVFETLTMNTETSGLIDNSVGGAVIAVGTIGGIGSGDLDVEFESVTSNAEDAAVLIIGATGRLALGAGAVTSDAGGVIGLFESGVDLTIDADISGDVSVVGSGPGAVTIDFNGRVEGETVDLRGNSEATIRFDGGLSLSAPGPAPAFSAVGGGTVAVTGDGNTIEATGAGGLVVTDTSIHADGLTFDEISSTGGEHGIDLENTGTAGGLTVTGVEDTCSAGGSCSGGTITGSTGAAVRLVDVGGGARLRHVGIVVNDVNGIDAERTGGLQLQASRIGRNGAAGVRVLDMTGDLLVEESNLVANHHNLVVTQETGSASAEIVDSHLGHAGVDGLVISGAGQAAIDVSVIRARIENNDRDGVRIEAPSGSPSITVGIHDSALSTSGRSLVGLESSAASSTRLVLADSTLEFANAPVRIAPTESANADVIVRNSVVDGGYHSIYSNPTGAGNTKLLVESTRLSGYTFAGLYLTQATSISSPTWGVAHYTVRGNTFADPATDTAVGVRIIAGGGQPGDQSVVCAQIGGTGSAWNDLDSGGGTAGVDVELNGFSPATVRLPGWTGNVSAYLRALNNSTSLTVDPGSATLVNGAACSLPDEPSA